MPASAYLGCYNDHEDGRKCDLHGHVVSGGCSNTKSPGSSVAWPRTIEACNYLCLQANKTNPFQYFGVQMGGTGCFCGDSYGAFGKVGDAACNVACYGNAKEMCGGANLNSVWKTVQF